ncbi:MAG TPA: AAC(3) family N-acetyltransferase [Candidatus Polarisedimenticolaceae bacterium]|nr:AAC(3) family N-acetyltransferase [Candidatus Polarisedimenticolaceae bacterium]
MNLPATRVRVPATVEFLARCVHGARRRFGRSRGGVDDDRSSRAPVRNDARVFARALAELGIRSGDLLMVHSSGAAIERLGWELPEFLDFLLDYLGPAGTLAMPSHPKLLRRNGRDLYDVRRSPSTVGLLTELFRRRPGTLRSRYPLSAAAARGVRAEALITDHRRSWAPHDEHSPYAKLADLGGKALCIGCPLDRITVLHVAEDVLRDELPVAGFHERREIGMRDGGPEEQMTVHARAGWLWWYLALGRWTYDMYSNGLARDARIDGVTLRVTDAGETVEWMKTGLRGGRWIYPLAWANRWLRLGPPGQEHDA